MNLVRATPISLAVFFTALVSGNLTTNLLIKTLDQSLRFIDNYYTSFNIDGAIGVTIAEANLLETLQHCTSKQYISILEQLAGQCRKIRMKLISILPEENCPKEVLFKRFLLNPKIWQRKVYFLDGQLDDLGVYKNWTRSDLVPSKVAQFKGISTDECLMELLAHLPEPLHAHSCWISSRCQEVMFGGNGSSGYLLTHRLLFLQIARMVNCKVNKTRIGVKTKSYCTLILKEARTNEQLGFPERDIFLEQVVLCGLEGFSEFLIEKWQKEMVDWQTPQGCYQPRAKLIQKSCGKSHICRRTSNVVAFECTDHTTGLGVAALSLSLQHNIQNQR